MTDIFNIITHCMLLAGGMIPSNLHIPAFVMDYAEAKNTSREIQLVRYYPLHIDN